MHVLHVQKNDNYSLKQKQNVMSMQTRETIALLYKNYQLTYPFSHSSFTSYIPSNISDRQKIGLLGILPQMTAVVVPLLFMLAKISHLMAVLIQIHIYKSSP